MGAKNGSKLKKKFYLLIVQSLKICEIHWAPFDHSEA